MYAKQQDVYSKLELSGVSVESLHELHSQTMKELESCAHFLPKDSSEDKEADLREAALLEFEQAMLDRASRIPLKNVKDIEDLIDFWESLSGVNEGAYQRPADKIAMNIFRHLSAHLR